MIFTKKAIRAEADRIEASAKDQLTAWIITSQIGKYEAAMERVRVLRYSLMISNITLRRQFLTKTNCVA